MEFFTPVYVISLLLSKKDYQYDIEHFCLFPTRRCSWAHSAGGHSVPTVVPRKGLELQLCTVLIDSTAVMTLYIVNKGGR